VSERQLELVDFEDLAVHRCSAALAHHGRQAARAPHRPVAVEGHRRDGVARRPVDQQARTAEPLELQGGPRPEGASSGGARSNSLRLLRTVAIPS
jgi:hypothetical protein